MILIVLILLNSNFFVSIYLTCKTEFYNNWFYSLVFIRIWASVYRRHYVICNWNFFNYEFKRAFCDTNLFNRQNFLWFFCKTPSGLNLLTHCTKFFDTIFLSIMFARHLKLYKWANFWLKIYKLKFLTNLYLLIFWMKRVGYQMLKWMLV